MLTADVWAVKVAVVDPASKVTEAGTVATAVSLLESVATRPPAGAGDARVMVPVEGVPPMTVVGLNVSEVNTDIPVLRAKYTSSLLLLFASTQTT